MKRKIFLTLAILIAISFLILPAASASAVGNPAEASQATSQFWDDFSSHFKDITWIPPVLIGTILPGLVLIIWKKELPKKIAIILSFICLLVLSVYELLVCPLGGAKAGTWYLAALFLLTSLIGVKLYYDAIARKDEENSRTNKDTVTKAVRYIQRKIGRFHAAIECIQLYRYTAVEGNQGAEYYVEYIDGAKRKDRNVEINALIGLNLILDSKTKSEAENIVALYDQYNNTPNEIQLETTKTVLNSALKSGITRIKEHLEQIGSADQITNKECCLARVLMVYCAISASLSKETTFVGFDNNALGLDPTIEHALLAHKRTGILGSIILQDYPYAFFYNRGGDKRGRTYYSFICEGETEKYIVLVALKLGNDVVVPDIGLSRALNKIKETLQSKLAKQSQEVTENE